MARCASGPLSLALATAVFPAFAAPDGLNIDDKTGIVVAGAWGERRAYAPLDIAEILPGFFGIWSVGPDQCEAAINLPDPATKIQNGVIILRNDGITAKSGYLRVTRAYIHAPPDIANKTMKKAKAVGPSARRYQRAHEMLVFVEVDDRRGAPTAIRMQLSDDNHILRIGERLPQTAWIGCGPPLASVKTPDQDNTLKLVVENNARHSGTGETGRRQDRPLHKFPQTFRGRWAHVAADCRAGGVSAILTSAILSIDPRGFRQGDSRFSAIRIIQDHENPRQISVSAHMSGDRRELRSLEQFTLSSDGQILEWQRFETMSGPAIRLYRCQ